MCRGGEHLSSRESEIIETTTYHTSARPLVNGFQIIQSTVVRREVQT